MTEAPLRLLGVPGSPYSRKLRAALRYRRIPHLWIQRGSSESRDLPRPRVDLLPQVVWPGSDTAETDTTPLLRELELRYPEQAARSLLPDDPVLAFLDSLLEDYADEWLTKCMFHYRWAFAADIEKASRILPRWMRVGMPEEMAVAMGKEFAARQIERLWVVGSNETTAPVIEASYRRLLALLDAHLLGSRFVLGARPGRADFGLYGQLTQLTGFDPTPAALALAEAPRVVAWVDLLEDLSGVEPAADGWLARDALPESFRALLAEVGRVHVPFLLANGEALAKGAERVECEIDGRPWQQRPFPYQGKCLAWLRAERDELAPADRAALDAILAGTGCEALFA